MKKQPAILVAFGDALASPEACYSLIDAGFSVHVACRRGVDSGIRRSRLVSIYDVTPPEVDCQLSVDELSALARSCGAAAVLPLDDLSLWMTSRHRSQFDCPIAAASEAAVDVAMDKRKQIDFAKASGFLVPETGDFSKDLQSLPWESFPCILKGALAARPVGKALGRGRAFFCDSPERLEEARIHDAADDPLILQAWQKGVGVGVFGFRTAEGVRAWSGHRRVRMMNPAGSGSSCCESNLPSEETKAKVDAFLKLIDWQGLFMVELLEGSDGRQWFMELNGRTWGSMSLARAGGMEYPAWAVQEALNDLPPLPESVEGSPCRARHFGRELVHLLLVLRGPGRNVGMTWPKRVSTLFDLLTLKRGDRWYNRRRGDIAVFRSDAIQCIRAQVRRKG